MTDEKLLLSNNWADAASYAYTSSHGLRDWGWEFLRRNKEYQADWRAAINRLSAFDIYELDQYIQNLPDDNFEVWNIAADEKELQKHRPQECTANFTDLSDLHTLQICDPTAHRWGLTSFQNPNQKRLLPETAVPSLFFTGFSADKSSNGLHYVHDTLVCRLDLRFPIAKQQDVIRETAEFIIKNDELDRPIARVAAKNDVWARYIRCLDAQDAGAKRSHAAEIIFPKEVNKLESWDETLKQAKTMAKEKFLSLIRQ